MIFTIQAYLEDYFDRCGLHDKDQYAVRLANLYDRERHSKDAASFLSSMRRVRTVFYRRNAHTQRARFERKLLTLLDTRFKKKALFTFPRRSLRKLSSRVVG